MNPIARHLLYNHYCDYLDPLNEPEFAQRQDANPALPPVEVVRMLIAGPGHQLMQAICTMGVSDVRRRRGRAKSPRHVEFMALVPAAWDLQDPEHWWVMDMMANLCDFTMKTRTPIDVGHTIDMSPQEGDLPEGVNMEGVVLLPPAHGGDGIALCPTGLLRRVSVLMMLPVTRAELEENRQHQTLLDRFAPKEGNPVFLCARSR